MHALTCFSLVGEEGGGEERGGRGRRRRRERRLCTKKACRQLRGGKRREEERRGFRAGTVHAVRVHVWPRTPDHYRPIPHELPHEPQRQRVWPRTTDHYRPIPHVTPLARASTARVREEVREGFLARRILSSLPLQSVTLPVFIYLDPQSPKKCSPLPALSPFL